MYNNLTFSVFSCILSAQRAGPEACVLDPLEDTEIKRVLVFLASHTKLIMDFGKIIRFICPQRKREERLSREPTVYGRVQMDATRARHTWAASSPERPSAGARSIAANL